MIMMTIEMWWQEPMTERGSDSIPDRQRLEIAEVYREMDSLGCEITRVYRRFGSVERWDVEWRVKDRRISPRVYGATGATPMVAARSALENARSDLSEADWVGSGVGAARLSLVHTADDRSTPEIP
jgi:hypothetical protein